MVVSVWFDTTLPQACAADRGWDLEEWADRAGCSMGTLKTFLADKRRLKITTVEQILQPLGLRACDVVRTLPPLKMRPISAVLLERQ